MKSAGWMTTVMFAACAGAMPTLVNAQTATPGPAAAPAPAAVQPFVGVVTADHVYVRAGANEKFYDVGQLHKGDMVNVVGMQGGWYQITPPKGTYALIAKELVETDAGGASGTVKGDTVNVRAGSATYPNSDYAVIGKAKKGNKVAIVGMTEKYYKVMPPAGTELYISPQFVKSAAAGSVYEAAAITMPNAMPVHGGAVAATGPATMPAGGVAIRPPGGVIIEEPGVVATQPATRVTEAPATQPATTQVAATQGAGTKPVEVVVVPPLPAPVQNGAYDTFTALNSRTQAELQKPLLERDLAGLLKEYEGLQAAKNVPGSIQQGCAARVEMIKTQMHVQELAKEASGANGKTLEEQRKALQTQWQDARQRMADMEKNTPPIAEGVLKTSTTIADKYVLVNPTTGRVVAYVDPTSPIDLSRLLGQYVGVHGSYAQDGGLGIRVIKVQTATMMAQPEQ